MIVSYLGRRKPLGPNASEQAREYDDRMEANARARWTLGLFAPAFVIALLVWISAPFVGRALGSMVVAYFALGAVLAAINVFEFAIAWAIARNWFGKGAKPYVVAGIVALWLSECMATSVSSGASLRRRRLPCAEIGRRLSPSPR